MRNAFRNNNQELSFFKINVQPINKKNQDYSESSYEINVQPINLQKSQ